MPPSKTLTREQVINAAFTLVRAKGLGALSARNVAKKLKTSTSPIYGYFRNMDQVKREMAAKAMQLLREYQTKRRTTEPFFDMGLGYIEFAGKEKKLFFEVLADKSILPCANDKKWGSEMIAIMKSDPSLTGLSDDLLLDLLLKMWIFVHGLASLINIGGLGELSEEKISAILHQAGQAVILDTLKKKNKEK